MTVDEVSHKRGHRYPTIVTNLENGLCTWAGEGARGGSPLRQIQHREAAPWCCRYGATRGRGADASDELDASGAAVAAGADTAVCADDPESHGWGAGLHPLGRHHARSSRGHEQQDQALDPSRLRLSQCCSCHGHDRPLLLRNHSMTGGSCQETHFQRAATQQRPDSPTRTREAPSGGTVPPRAEPGWPEPRAHSRTHDHRLVIALLTCSTRGCCSRQRRVRCSGSGSEVHPCVEVVGSSALARDAEDRRGADGGRGHRHLCEWTNHHG